MVTPLFEADGSCPYMVENRRRVQPGEDWLEVIRRPRRSFTLLSESWTAALYDVQGRYAEADAERERQRRLDAARAADPLLDVRLFKATYHPLSTPDAFAHRAFMQSLDRR